MDYEKDIVRNTIYDRYDRLILFIKSLSQDFQGIV